MGEQEFAATVGQPWQCEEGVELILAPNPSPMTGPGTNTYLLGKDRVVVIDPGPDLPPHGAAVRRAIDRRPVDAILVTHSHRDHSPLSPWLATETGAPVLAYGDSKAGRSKVMMDLARQGLTTGGQGVDVEFRPDQVLSEGDEIAFPGGDIRALHVPGHMGNHMCFVWRDMAFTGDHVLGWASTLVSPPDGDLTDFMLSCQKLSALDVRVFYPGHGAPITKPKERLQWLVDHRKSRESQVLAVLEKRPACIAELVDEVYADIPSAMHPAARRNLFAHLVDLSGRGRVSAEPALSETAVFTITDAK